MVLMAVIVEKNNPGHLASRAEKPANSATWDVALMRGVYIFRLCSTGGGSVGWWTVWVDCGPAVAASAGGGVCGSQLQPEHLGISTNKFTKTHVAIQEEEGHQVVSTGPYGHIRHPMYSAGLLMRLGIPLVLGSLWGLIPGGLCMLFMVVRTALEDRTLTADLPGYREYSQQVGYRLIPGIW